MVHRFSVLVAVVLALLAGPAAAAVQGPPAYVYTGTAPSGYCTGNRVWVDALGSGIYYCNAGTWVQAAMGGGGVPGHAIWDKGVLLATEPALNFTGTGINCFDSAGVSTTCDVTLPAAPTWSQILNPNGNKTWTTGAFTTAWNATPPTSTSAGFHFNFGTNLWGATGTVGVMATAIPTATATGALLHLYTQGGSATSTTPFWPLLVAPNSILSHAARFGGAVEVAGPLNLLTEGTAAARLTLGSGTDPAVPVSGDLWWNGTNLNFYTGATARDLLAAGTYTLPEATTAVLGGVKVGTRLTAVAGVLSADAQDWSVITGKPTTFAPVDATASVTGGLRLTGDLGGTATAPTVPNLANRSGIGACGANTWASTLNGASAPTCTQPAFSNISGSATAGQLPIATISTRGAVVVPACSTGYHFSSVDGVGNLVCTADAAGGGGVTSVTGTSPIVTTGTSAVTVSMASSPVFGGTVTAGSALVTGPASLKGTAATAGAPLQASGYLHLTASAWSTTDTVAYPADFDIAFLPTAETTTTGAITAGKWRFLTGATEVASVDLTGAATTLRGKIPAYTITTATWASSATANTTGIVGTGATPLTSPAYAAGAPFGFRCTVSTTRPATTNGPRYGVAASSGSVTRISFTTRVGLAATTETITRLTAAMTANCAANCSTAMTTGTLAQVMDDVIQGTGVMNAAGSVSLYMAPSAAAANTAQIGSNCIWY